MSAATLGPKATKALQRLKERLRDRFGDALLRVILFGSAARGDAGPESDLDVAVVLKEIDRKIKREVFDLAAEVELEYLVVMSVFAVSAKEFEKLKSRERRIVLDIEREGVPL